MRPRFLLLLIMLLTSISLAAQLTIGGTKPVYDKRTKTYLLTVPETVFGRRYQAPVVIDNGVTEVTIDGKAVTTAVDFPVIDGDTCYTFSFRKNNVLTQSTIHFTYLPIMCITGSFGNDYVEAPVEMIFPKLKGVFP